MKFTFIGTSHGIPEANRRCSCLMVETGGNIYFFDMGTHAIEALRNRGRSIEDVKGIFITHMHGDHTNGLIPFIDLITWYFRKVDPDVVLPDLEAVRVINDWLTVTQNGCQKAIRYHQARTGIVFEDGLLKVTAIPTQHCPGSHAYLLEAEGKSVLYTGDLANPEKDFPYVEQELDLLICESAHFPATQYLLVLEKQSIQKMCVTHYAPRFMEELYQTKRLLDKQGICMLIATDGLELSV